MSDDVKPHFDRYAKTYRELHQESIKASGEGPDYFAAYKARYARDYFVLAREPMPSRFLDFGCGVGGSISHLTQQFPTTEFHGVDVSGESIALAAKAHPNSRFGVIEGDSLPFEIRNFDGAMAACVYHHIQPDQRANWTSEVFKALRPGGRFFIFEHNPLNPLTRKAVRECPFDDDAVLLPKQESVELMKTAGFVEIDVDFIVFFPKFMAKFRPFERFLAKAPIGAQYAAVGRKP